MQAQKLSNNVKLSVGDKIECLAEQICFALTELRQMLAALEKIREKAAKQPARGKIIPLRTTATKTFLQ